MIRKEEGASVCCHVLQSVCTKWWGREIPHSGQTDSTAKIRTGNPTHPKCTAATPVCLSSEALWRRTLLLFLAIYQTFQSTAVFCRLSDFTLLLFSAVYNTSHFCCSLLFIRLHSFAVLWRLSVLTLSAVLCCLSDFTLLLFSAVYQTSLFCCSLPFIRLHSTAVLCRLSDFTLLLFSAVYLTSLYCCSLPFIRLHSIAVLCRL